MACSLPAPAPASGCAPGRRETVFVAVSFAVAFACSECVLFGGFGAGAALFWAVSYGAAAAYLKPGARFFTRQSLLSFAPAALTALCFLFFDNGVLRFFNVFALAGLTVLHLRALTEENSAPLIRFGALSEIFRTLIVFPFRHLDRGVAAVTSRMRGSKRPTAARVLLTLLLVSPLAAVVIALLASSDAGFERLVTDLVSALTIDVRKTLFKIAAALLLTLPVYSLLFSLREEKPLTLSRPKAVSADPVAISVGAGVFCLIYLIYIGMQAGYLFSALRGVLPAGFTYAGYARRGFFELNAVAVINLGLLAAAVSLPRRDGKRLLPVSRIPALLLAALTLLLIVTAFSKMVLYMGIYGLTPLRLYTSWFMLLLAFFTLLLALKAAAPSVRLAGAAAAGAVALWLALNYADTDALIARYNVDRYLTGGASTVDLSALGELSGSMVPQLSRLTGDATYGAEARRIIGERGNTADGGWQNWSVSRQAAAGAAGK